MNSGTSPRISFAPLYASERNLGDISPYFTVYAVALILGRLVTGRIADRYGRGAAVMPGLMLAFASMIAMSVATDMVLVIVAAVLFGVAFALVMPALNALVVDVTKSADRGSAMATFTAAMEAGFGGGAFLLGFVIQQVGYESMYRWGSILLLLGIVAYFVFVCRKMSPVDSALAPAPSAEISR